MASERAESERAVSEQVARLFRLDGRVALVTGAASGLGRAIARGFAEVGASVAGADLNDAGLESLAAEIGNNAAGFQVDVTNESQVDRLVAQVLERFGRIDVLLNAAGIGARSPAEAYPLEMFKRVIDINLIGTFLCCQRVGRVMLEQGRGSIVNISSVSGTVGTTNSIGYQASKAGVSAVTRTFAIEWATRGVRVNAIAPSFFETPETRAEMARDNELLDYWVSHNPMGRVGQPIEIVGPALFLASDASSLVTGHILMVDGGWTAQ